MPLASLNYLTPPFFPTCMLPTHICSVCGRSSPLTPELISCMIFDGSWIETVRKENRRPGSWRFISVRIYSVRSSMTQQLPINDSWKFTSTGAKIWEYIDSFALLTFFSSLPLASKIKRKTISVILLRFSTKNLQITVPSCHHTPPSSIYTPH